MLCRLPPYPLRPMGPRFDKGRIACRSGLPWFSPYFSACLFAAGIEAAAILCGSRLTGDSTAEHADVMPALYPSPNSLHVTRTGTATASRMAELKATLYHAPFS